MTILDDIAGIEIKGFGGCLDDEFGSAEAALRHLRSASDVDENETESFSEYSFIEGEYFDESADIACTAVTVFRGDTPLTCYSFAGGDEVDFVEKLRVILA